MLENKTCPTPFEGLDFSGCSEVPLASSLHTFESEALGEAYSDLNLPVKGIALLDEIPALKDALNIQPNYGGLRWIKRLEANKSGHYYLRKLSRSEKKRFIKNLRQYIPFKKMWLDSKFKNADDFISTSFCWDQTPEGHDYWEAVDARMRWITNLQ